MGSDAFALLVAMFRDEGPANVVGSVFTVVGYAVMTLAVHFFALVVLLIGIAVSYRWMRRGAQA